MSDVQGMLTGGDRRTLHGVADVIALVEARPGRLAELFGCIFADDDVVRMRAADACEKLCRSHPDWFEPYVERMLTDVAASGQPSVQWHLAQMLAQVPLDDRQAARAAEVVAGLLGGSDDWIVRNCSLESLASFARRGTISRQAMSAQLDRVAEDERKSVRSRVEKLRREFDEP